MNADHEARAATPMPQAGTASPASDYRKDAVVWLILFFVVPYIGTFVALRAGDPGRFELLAHLSIYVWFFDLVGVHPAFVSTALGIYGVAAPLALLAHYFFLQAAKTSARFKRAHDRLCGAGLCVLLLEFPRFRPCMVDQWAAAMETPVFHSAATASLSGLVCLVIAMEVFVLAYVAYAGLLALWRLPIALGLWLAGLVGQAITVATMALARRREAPRPLHEPGDVAFWATLQAKQSPPRHRAAAIIRAIRARWPRVADQLTFPADRTHPVDGKRCVTRIFLTAAVACLIAEILRISRIGEEALSPVRSLNGVAMFARNLAMRHDLAPHLVTQTLAAPFHLHALHRRMAPVMRRDALGRFPDMVKALVGAAFFVALLYTPVAPGSWPERETGWITSMIEHWHGFYALCLLFFLLFVCGGILLFTGNATARWRRARDGFRESGW